MDWLLNPVNGPIVAFVGLALTLVSMIITVIGFVIAILQIRRTQTATVAAAQAVKDLRSRVASFDATVEVSQAAAALKETQRHLNNDQWRSAVESYLTAKDALVRISALSDQISDNERIQIPQMLADIGEVCNRIEMELERDSVKIGKSKVLKKAREHSALVQTIGIQIQRALV